MEANITMYVAVTVQQLEVLFERILHQIDEFHMTFINGVIYSPPIYFDFTFTHTKLENFV